MTRRLSVLLLAAWLTGCASTGNSHDPLEPINRKVFAFNDTLDTVALQPVAKAYVAATPLPVRSGIGNFFANLEDVWTGLNNLLQGKVGRAGSDVGRLLINSTVGIFGLFDVASELGLEKHDEDLGQTLGVWGVGPGLEKMLNKMGIWHFDQIAAWTAKELKWVDENLKGFKGRATRDEWVKQSKKLATGWRPENAIGEKPKGKT
jgi:ABC-type transporter lipoprotein component MlaA